MVVGGLGCERQPDDEGDCLRKSGKRELPDERAVLDGPARKRR